jgi:hypothetical protein
LCTFPNIFFSFQASHLKIYQEIDATLISLTCKNHIHNSSRCVDIHNLVLSRALVFSYFYYMRRARDGDGERENEACKEHKKETKLPYVVCVARAKNIGICDSPCIVPAP